MTDPIDVTGLVAREAHRVQQAMALEMDRRLAEPLIRAWQEKTEQEREQARRDAAERAERQRVEAAARHELRVREAHGRHEALMDRCFRDDVLRAVVDLHVPHEDGYDRCAGCPTFEDREWGETEFADWPCDTFLLIESQA